MSKSLYFAYSASDNILVPSDKIGRVVKSHLSDSINLYIDSGSRTGDAQIITLDVVSGKGTEAVKDLNDVLKNSRDGVIVVADNVTGASVSRYITGVTAAFSTIYPSS